jgi:8-oxo-dGTP pyrophosphatase MutT (NUDIX family)
VSADRGLDKVTGFVTRARAGAIELLVFEHPSAGVQLPAGTVEPGEAPAAAVLREVAEETGVTSCTVVEHLTTTATSLPDGCAIVVETVALMASPGVAVGAGELRRGLTVEVREEGPFSRVVYATTWRR